MAEYKKPLPIPDDASMPFFEGAKRHHLMLQKCNTCGAVLWPVKTRCDMCLGKELQWVKSSGKGTLYTYALIHHLYHPGFADEIPYNVSIVELEEGLRVSTTVAGVPNSELKIGMALQVCFDDITDEVTLPKFKPASWPSTEPALKAFNGAPSASQPDPD